MDLPAPIPAILNRDSGSADAVRAVLEQRPGFDVRVRAPEDVELAVRAAVLEGHRRIAIGGGDGTIASAANVIVGTPVELAVLPGGTLNHFARDHDLPTVTEEAAELALVGTARPVGVGRVNDRIFLSTSSVGAYVALVRLRSRMERVLGYTLASFLAASRVFVRMPTFGVEVATPSGARAYRTPLVFIGIGERDLRVPALGARVREGRRGLHLMVVRDASRSSVMALALSAATRGIEGTDDTHLDALVVDACTITPDHPARVSVDGEIARLAPPLRYEFLPDSLRLVSPGRR